MVSDLMVDTMFYQRQCMKIKSEIVTKKEATKDINEPNPIQPISKSTRPGQSQPAAPRRSTDEKTLRQLPAHQCRPPGGARQRNQSCRMKTKNALRDLDICFCPSTPLLTLFGRLPGFQVDIWVIALPRISLQISLKDLCASHTLGTAVT